MKFARFVVSIVATLIATSAIAAPRLTVEPLRSQRGTLCTADRAWCVKKAKDENSLDVYKAGQFASHPIASVPMPKGGDIGEVEGSPWGSLIRFGAPDQGVALIGVVLTERQMYSGGGASVDRLVLYEVREGRPPQKAIELPLSSSIMIRACFTRQDEKARRGACHDEYDFDAKLSPLPQDPSRLVYKSTAETYPGKVSRNEDSTKQKPLRKQDLRRVVDPACSVTRVLTRNPNGTLSWDKPLPPCTDYLEP